MIVVLVRAGVEARATLFHLMATLLHTLKAKLSADEFAALCKAITNLDSSFFNAAMMVQLKPVTVRLDADQDDDPKVTPIGTAHGYREVTEERDIERLVKATRVALVKAVPERVRRWVLLQVIIGLDD